MTGTVNSGNDNKSSETAFVLEDPYPRTRVTACNELLSTSSFQHADTLRSLIGNFIKGIA